MFPILLAPFGLTTAVLPPIPMPSAIIVEFLPPLDWSARGPDAADDEEFVSECYDEISRGMQSALDRLHAQDPHPVIRGVNNLVRQGRTRLKVPEV